MTQRLARIREAVRSMIDNVGQLIESFELEGPVGHDKHKKMDENTWCSKPLCEHTEAEKRLSTTIRNSGKDIVSILQEYTVRTPSEK